MVYPFSGTPPVDLLIEGSVPRITLQTDLEGQTSAPANLLRHVRVQTINVSGRWRIAISIEGSDLMLDGHAMLCVIADRIQLDKLDPILAIAQTLEQWRAVLATRSRLTTEDEVGLVGELLVLEALCAATGPAALVAWRGARTRSTTSASKRSTSKSRRRRVNDEHWISGIAQLPYVGSSALASYRSKSLAAACRAEACGTDRQSRSAIADSDAARREAGTCRLGRDRGRLYVERWTLRSPDGVPVDGDFPSI